MKNTLFAKIAAALGLLGLVITSPAANIVWVSDATALGFSGPGAGLTDQGFVTLLQNAGHNVIRFNGPDSQNTLLTASEIAALNTNDLIILGRAGASGQFQAPQGPQWNTAITAPLICMSPYFVRPDGGRFGWFTGGTLPDDIPTVLTTGDPANAAVDFLFGGVAMNGSSTTFPFDELIDRNTSHIQNTPVAGGIVYASATFPNESGGALTTAYGIVGFPAGTTVQTNPVTLAGFRMYFSGGCRESATAPNGIGQGTGRENLSPTGENIFLRAVRLAINNGVPPVVNPSTPVGVVVQPTNVTVSLGDSATFFVAVTGAAPRTIQWQRDTGDATTFTNIPGASTTFSASILALSNLTVTDFNQARFRALVSNPNNSVNSDTMMLTVLNDTTAPVPLSAASLDGMAIGIRFNELLDTNTVNNSATEIFNYTVNTGVPNITGITLGGDGRSVTLSLDAAVGTNFTVRMSAVADRFGNGIPEPGVTLVGTNLGLTAVDVGALNPSGNQIVDSSTFQVMGGGLDVAAASDQLRFLYKTVSGDFDARVRVRELTGTNRLESLAKALLTARESTANNSAAVNVFVTTATPGDNSISSRYRTATGAAYTTNTPAYSLTNTPQISPGGLPNAWMRIKRVGDQFTTYRGTNGIDWVEMDNASIPLAASLNVGVGTVSHRNGVIAIGTFSNLRIGPVINAPVLTNSISTNGVFSATFGTQNGVSYSVLYRDLVNAGLWNTLTNLSGDGAAKSFIDPGPVSPTGRRFYKVGAQ